MEQHSAGSFDWALDGTPTALWRNLPTRLGARPGRLHVRRGRVWVTRPDGVQAIVNPIAIR